MDQEEYSVTAKEAISKSFVALPPDPSKEAKSKVLGICEANNLRALRDEIARTKKGTLSLFFSATTHKKGTPFRTIVAERDCWQKVLCKFLQKNLSLVPRPQPFAIKDSAQCVNRLLPLHGADLNAFSVHITDLYYSLEPVSLLDFVSDSIHEGGLVAFQNKSGIAADSSFCTAPPALSAGHCY